jgi:alpha-glucosidase
VELQDTRTNNLPEVHDVMKEMRASADKGFKPTTYPGTRVFIGETYLPNIAELAKQYGTADHPEFHLPMDTQILGINKMDAAAFRAKLNDVETGIGNNVPLLVFDNHDNPRIDARYGDGVHNEDIERVIATVLFSSKGTALFYYGDEIGMKTTPPERKEDVKDPVGRVSWPFFKGRDGERTPMQWDDSPNAGFTTGTPWLPVPPTYKTVNVKAEEGKPDSLLTWYQKLIELKKTNPAFANGNNLMLDQDNAKVLSWLRQAPDGTQVLVSCNFTADPQTVNLSGGGVKGTKANTLLKSPSGSEPASLDAVQLPPFGVWIGQVQ